MKTKTREVLTSDKPLSYKIKYFWEYNNKIILFILFCVIMAGWMGYDAMHKAPEPDLTIAAIGDSESLAKLQALGNEKESGLIPVLATTDKVQVNYAADTDSASRQKYVVQMAAGELGLIIADEKDYNQLIKDGGLKNLKKSDSKIAALVDDTDPYGISLGKVDSSIDSSLQNYKICIPVNAEHPKAALKALESLQ